MFVLSPQNGTKAAARMKLTKGSSQLHFVAGWLHMLPSPERKVKQPAGSIRCTQQQQEEDGVREAKGWHTFSSHPPRSFFFLRVS
jgi:hypothetical protein